MDHRVADAFVDELKASTDAAERTKAKRARSAGGAGSQVETVVSMVTLGGIVYVATVSNVYRVSGDELVRLHWPRGPQRRRKGRGD